MYLFVWLKTKQTNHPCLGEDKGRDIKMGEDGGKAGEDGSYSSSSSCCWFDSVLKEKAEVPRRGNSFDKRDNKSESDDVLPSFDEEEKEFGGMLLFWFGKDEKGGTKGGKG